MKANELMIGDLVFSPKLQKVFKVMGIENDHDEIKSVGCHVPMRMLEPIPLTEEVLKANGFDHPKFDDGTEVKNIMAYDKDGLMWLNKEKDYFFISSSDANIHIHFVHQLQHALRLCGLNDLADNFKIE